MPKLRYVISLLVVLILQTTFLSRFPVMETTPSLFLVYLVALSILYGSKWGGYTGIGLGLLEDIMFSNVLGVHALVYFLCASFVGRVLYHNQNQLATGTVMTVVVSFASFLGNGLILWLLGQATTTLWMLGTPLLYFALINAILYPVVMLVLRRALKPERERRFNPF
ncbi:MAG: rod shape-determining protein MreD [Peptoniphilaceae bacterium]|nr:rod shape-determining protein MreD [Peptoniphilaceae bacterium]MDY6085257.1 rod shape-determining protein MreD [Peptoniphilaceae bacterium]